MFARPDGSPIRPATVSRTFLRLQADLGLDRLTLHGLRHTFATLDLLAGVPTKLMSEVLGHAQTSTMTDIYQHVIRGQQAKAVNLVAGLISRAQ